MSSKLPRAVSLVGLFALLGSMACFPLPTVVLPGSGPRPTPQPERSYASSAAPTIAPSVSSLVYPSVSRKYTVEDHKRNTVRVYRVTDVTGSVVTYELTTTEGSASPMVLADRKVTQTNGVFWTEAGDSPVTQDIENSPMESITVKAGTYPCFKVVAGVNTFWFCGGICVKGAGPDLDFELSQLQ
ncbi:MAG: hypothetical protein JWM80_393 [Cyanobacteria bacterium RYN_339]|nr:hypothetical protein [Cyanobacteria bacterium RYN_339]